MMRSIDDYILGNEELHAQFRRCVTMIGKLVASTPEPVGMIQIEALTGASTKEMAKLCERFWRAGLIRPDYDMPNAWRLACDPCKTTLEGVLCCVLAEQQDERCRQSGAKPGQAELPSRELDPLIMQMTMAINQSIFRYLRQFTLERLRLNLGAMFPPAPQATPASGGPEETARALVSCSVNSLHKR